LPKVDKLRLSLKAFDVTRRQRVDARSEPVLELLADSGRLEVRRTGLALGEREVRTNQDVVHFARFQVARLGEDDHVAKRNLDIDFQVNLNDRGTIGLHDRDEGKVLKQVSLLQCSVGN
jgi:hypothetical protein